MKFIKYILIITILFGFFTVACTKSKKTNLTTMQNNKKAVLIVAPEGFQDKEYQDTKKSLVNKDVNVYVSSTTDQAVGKFGKKIKVDIRLKNLKVNDFDAIAFIGGPGATAYQNNMKALSVAKKANDNDKVLGAICIAPTILAKAGVLKGKKATVWSSNLDQTSIEILENNGAQFINEPVVVDKNIITGNGPQAASQFGLEIAKKIIK